MGPILFILFTADFHSCMPEYKISAYADDTQILVTSKSEDELRRRVEAVIEEAQRWFSANSLKINPTKTEVLIFGRRNTLNKLSFSVREGGKSCTIENTEKMKILGVYLDEDISWKAQVKSVKSKASRIIRNLARTTHVLPLKQRRILYDALVTPHFNYCDTVWGGMSQRLNDDLQRTGNFAAKALLGMKKKDSAKDALLQLNMMPFKDKRSVHLGVLVHKLNKNIGPKELIQNYKGMIERTHSHQTRMASRGDMNHIQHRSSKFEKSTIHRALNTWNSIPDNIRQIDSTGAFKRSYQAHLLSIFQ